MIYNGILDTIGRTPMVKLKGFSTDTATVYAKIEGFNPSGSIKDRAAFYMINDALLSGKIKKDTTIIEPTSGNTGIGLAMVCAAMGFNLILTMPENMSVERVKILKAYGAEIVKTPKSEGMLGAITKAEQINKQNPNSYIPSQFENPANANAHFMTTAREIFGDLQKVDWIVCGVGSSGTIMGIKKYIEFENQKTKVCAVEPENSPMLSEGKFGTHKLQGIGANFVPKLVDKKKLDAIARVSDENAFACAKKLVREEGIFAGISSGAALAGVQKLLDKGVEGNIVVILPDSGMKYLSTELCDD